ncbi:MAG: MlaE family lipid ABC transporter permease subunit [Candidatus Tectomicrobia bacterium]|nr:MlaE family lipid ABC transporter permease subunit [Candidatus Tectomicrobia bacterium]
MFVTDEQSHAYQQQADIQIGDEDTLRCVGVWTIQQIADFEQRLARFPWPDRGELVWDASAIRAMDTAGAWLLQRTLVTLQQNGRRVVLRGLKPEFEALIKMVSLDDKEFISPATSPAPGWLEKIGRLVWSSLLQGLSFVSFLGESTVVFFHLVTHPHRIRWQALFSNLQAAGFNALPITGLLAFLMGVVIAYQGAVQLRTFGANIFIVDLVGISMLREIAPLVTAIIIAGRSGSAYTAQIGTMKITEEVDALRTIGIAPMEILVLPRVLALVVALPLLAVFADVMGVFGGMIIAYSQLGVGFSEFVDRFGDAVSLTNYLIGVGKTPAFAVIIALVGCYQGFQVKGDADSVGRHTTLSVVQGIFLVIIFDAFFSVLFSWLGL